MASQKKHLTNLLTFFFLIIAISGCMIHPRYYSTPGSDIYMLADYDDAIEHWLAHDEIHDNLIGLADAYILYQSWEVRQAYLNTYESRANPEPSRLELELERQTKQFNNGHEFWVGLYNYEKDWYQVTGDEPIWRFTLENDRGDIVRPLLIEEMVLSPDQSSQFLSQLTHGRKLYRVIFPIASTESNNSIIDSKTTSFTVRCHSLIGIMHFEWDLAPVPKDLL